MGGCQRTSAAALRDVFGPSFLRDVPRDALGTSPSVWLARLADCNHARKRQPQSKELRKSLPMGGAKGLH
eukprot:3575891-Amphidinium_carterae.1